VSAAQKNGPSGSAYVTYYRPEDALRCIESVDGQVWEGKQHSKRSAARAVLQQGACLARIALQCCTAQHNTVAAWRSAAGTVSQCSYGTRSGEGVILLSAA
jgi:hypothetical protein